MRNDPFKAHQDAKPAVGKKPPSLPPGFTPTKWREPKTGDKKLIVMFRNGWISRFAHTAKQWRWTDEGSDGDIVGVKFDG